MEEFCMHEQLGKRQHKKERRVENWETGVCKSENHGYKEMETLAVGAVFEGVVRNRWASVIKTDWWVVINVIIIIFHCLKYLISTVGSTISL